MSSAILLIALAAAIPNVDPHKICQSARLYSMGGDEKSAYNSCVREEQAARDQIRQKWAQFSADARDTCSAPGAVSISYVEVLTCLEMESGANFSGASARPSITSPSGAEPDAPTTAGKKP
jgi:hypothetical protein